MEFILASSNVHKVEELNLLFEKSKIRVTSPEHKIDVVEDGDTFQENALKKAKEYFEKFRSPTLADDSGLKVPAMPDILGVKSARFAPHLDNYIDKNNFLIQEMKHLKGAERAAYFVCQFCFYISPDEVYFFEGRVHGEIGEEIQGADGFGYDPIFLPLGQNGKSMAQVIDWKMANSHRAKAAIAANRFFEGYLK